MTRNDSGESEPSIEPSRDQFNELSAFQRDILIELAKLNYLNKESYGLAIENRLEMRYGSEIHHGRLYPNLDDLVQMGFIEKGKLDNRTNKYVLTTLAWEALSSRYQEFKWIVTHSDSPYYSDTV